MGDRVPFFSFSGSDSELLADYLRCAEEVIKSGWFILGSSLNRFEQDFAQYCGVRHALGVSNGLDALFLSLKALGIGPGDEVILPAHTFIATALAVSHTGATPVLVDVKMDSMTMCPESAQSKITSKTRAVIPVHLYGIPAEMDKIMAVAKENHLIVIEDFAQSQGASWDNKMTGSIGRINATSFYPVKNLGALGDAGCITTDDDQLAEKVRSLRNYGSVKKYVHQELGYNKRLDEMQASFLALKLKRLNQFNTRRLMAVDYYRRLLDGVGDLVMPVVPEKAAPAWHLFVVRTRQRDKLQQYLKSRGIGTLIHYPLPLHLQPAYAKLAYSKGDFPVAEEVADTCLSLPLYPGIPEADLDYVITAIKAFYGG